MEQMQTFILILFIQFITDRGKDFWHKNTPGTWKPEMLANVFISEFTWIYSNYSSGRFSQMIRAGLTFLVCYLFVFRKKQWIVHFYWLLEQKYPWISSELARTCASTQTYLVWPCCYHVKHLPPPPRVSTSFSGKWGRYLQGPPRENPVYEDHSGKASSPGKGEQQQFHWRWVLNHEAFLKWKISPHTSRKEAIQV